MRIKVPIAEPHIPLEAFDAWADYWRYDRGLNVIPAISRQKIPDIKWKQYQDNPISEEQDQQWKLEGAFRNGMAIITGKVHCGRYAGKYFNCIDCDNLKAIEELCTKNDVTVSLQDLAKEFVIEQHLDNISKAHAYFYPTIPIVPKYSSLTQAGIIKEMVENNRVPAYEIKSTSKNISFCTPSVHQNGSHYQIIGTIHPIVLDAESSNSLMQDIDNICTRYGLYYLKNADGSSVKKDKNSGLPPMSELLKEDAQVLEGGRHMTLLRYAESRIRLFYPTNTARN